MIASSGCAGSAAVRDPAPRAAATTGSSAGRRARTTPVDRAAGAIAAVVGDGLVPAARSRRDRRESAVDGPPSRARSAPADDDAADPPGDDRRPAVTHPRRPDPGDPVLAGHARRRAARPRLPDRRPARRRGAAHPLHDPGAVAARRDGAGPADPAGPTSRRGSSPSASRSRTSSSRGPGSAAAIKDLNDRLDEARIAAGPDPARPGTGIVLKLEDSTEPVPPGGNEADYLVGARTSGPWSRCSGRPAPRRSRSTASGSRPRPRSSTSAARSSSTPPTSPARTRSRRSARRTCSPGCRPRPGWQEFVRTRRGSFGIGISWAEPDAVDVPAFAGSVTLRESRAVPEPDAGRRRPPQPSASAAVRPAMRDVRSQLTLAAVAAILGLLVVVQLRARPAARSSQSMSAQELTDARRPTRTRENDRLRAEVATLQNQLAELRADRATRRDLGRPDRVRPRPDPGLDRARSGRRAAGVQITVDGEIDARRRRRPPQRAAQRGRGGDRDRRHPGRSPGTSVSGVPGLARRRRVPAPRPVHDPGDRPARDPRRVADPGRRDHRPARGDRTRARDRRGRAGRRADDPAGDEARPRPGPWPSASLIPSAG